MSGVARMLDPEARMQADTPARPPAPAARRDAYLTAITMGAALLFALNIWPGWQILPFLTSDTSRVLWLVNLSLAAGLAANVVYLAYDPPWFRLLGELVRAGTGVAAAVRLWQVFPFDFHAAVWSVAVRVLLAMVIVVSGTGIVVQLVWLARPMSGRAAHG
jgi:hypothetical protein